MHAAAFAGDLDSPFRSNGPDVGTLSLPSDTFPLPGEYELDFQRRIFAEDLTGVLGSPPNVSITRYLSVTVE